MPTAHERLTKFEAFAARNTPVLDAAEVRATMREVLDAINSAGGRFTPTEVSIGFADGFTEALESAQDQVTRMFARKLAGEG